MSPVTASLLLLLVYRGTTEVYAVPKTTTDRPEICPIVDYPDYDPEDCHAIENLDSCSEDIISCCSIKQCPVGKICCRSHCISDIGQCYDSGE
ncbi:hypothetical protein GDO78_020170 [Eleutherodactylus coqui]|uniref:WAP domain-containing protein n=1 Tax=Eleutherodactylus coqui TaxID=57060 RepID=A0A8J6JV76_ELECQ|nr:hypothetical protein GDO78_020170 [Eleutherodactylus coqui]